MDSLGKRNLGSMPQGDEWEGKVIQLFTKLTHRPNSTTSAFPDKFESLFAAPLLWVQTWAPKWNLIIPVREGDNSCAPQAVH